MVLGETELLERCTSGNLNLSCDNVDTRDFLGDRVLDLDTRIDFYKIVTEMSVSDFPCLGDTCEILPVLLVNQELSSTSVAVLHGLSQPDGISQDGVAGLNGQVLGRSNFNDLLVTTLHGAVTLVQVDDIALVVTEKLDLNVLGLVEEALDEDSSVAESRLRF